MQSEKAKYEMDATLLTSRRLDYIYAEGRIVAVHVDENSTESLFYVLTDHLGSWEKVLDESKTVVQQTHFDPWGNRMSYSAWDTPQTQTTFTFDRGFTGHEHLTAFGLINMNGRMYDPVTSAFLSVDQYVQSPETAQSFNRYAYCMNNPLRYVDPSGWLQVGGGASGYTPNSASNFDPYMFYGGHIPLEPRDLGIRQFDTTDPIITWMEENSLHGGGEGDVKPAGNAEVEMIRNTLPIEARPFVQLDKNGYINKFLLNLCKVESLNLVNLKCTVMKQMDTCYCIFLTGKIA